MRASQLCGPVFALSLAATPALAASPEAVVRDIDKTTSHAGRIAHDLGVVAMPIPISNPAIGSGVGLAGLALYKVGETDKPWATGVGGVYMENGSWAAGVFQKAHFAGDKVRLTAFAGTGDFQLDFYGIGSDAGSRGRSVTLDEQGDFGLAQGLVKVGGPLYLGPVYRYMKVQTSIDGVEWPFPNLPRPDFERESTTSALGIGGEYDTRDNEYNPRKGGYIDGQWLFANDALGSDFTYDRFNLAANLYEPLDKRSMLAARVAFCGAGDDAPFYDICMFGQNNDLRGYPSGQYRDRAMAAAQVEYRRELFWRFGMTAFVGVGGVAPSFDKWGSDLLPAAGLGLRFKASKKYGVNASLDYAVGKDGGAVYFYIGEAF